MKGRSIAFSNDPISVFTAAMAKAFRDSYASGFLGRTTLQKLMYLAKSLGVPIPASFGIYTYGPYSDAITFAVEGMVADDVLVDKSSDVHRYSNYYPGPALDELLEAYKPVWHPYYPTLRTVAEAFGRFEPQELELITTLLFLAQTLKAASGRAPDKAELLKRFRAVKGERFPVDKVSAWYETLSNAGLIERESNQQRAKSCHSRRSAE